jgi:Tol biopolymer transport system component
MRSNPDSNLDLWIGSADGQNLRRLTETSGQEFDAVFSPDSRHVLYSFAEQRPAGMMEVDGLPPPAETSLYETGFSGPGRILMPHAGSGRFSPDGRWIALLRGGSSSQGLEFGILPSAGGEFVPIPLRTSADDALQSCSAAVWSADSRFILLSARTRKTARYGWWLVNATSHVAVLTKAIEEMTATGLTTPPLLAGLAPQAWLPDGTVLTKGFGSGDIGIWSVRLNADSGRIEGRPAILSAPLAELRWFSVAGSRVLFDGGDLLSGLDVVPFDLDNARALGPGKGFRRNNPGGYSFLSLSADGSILAFASRQSTGKAPRAFTVELDSGRETAVASAGTDPAVAEQYLSISGDGRRLAFTKVPDAKRPLYEWDSDKGVTELITNDCACRPLSWTVDGRGLLVALPDARPQSIALFDLQTRQKSEILRSASYALRSAQASPDGGHVVLTTSTGIGLVAPFRGPTASAETEWRRLGEDGQRIGAAFWSPNGRRIYFAVLERDVQVRILTQAFDPARGDAVGDVTEVYRTEWQPTFRTAAISRITGSGNRIVLPTAVVSSDLWIADLANRP